MKVAIKSMKESKAMTESAVKMTSSAMWDMGYDIDQSECYFAQGKFSDGIWFDLVTADNYTEINAFPDNESVILRAEGSSESQVNELLEKLKGMTLADAKSQFPSLL